MIQRIKNHLSSSWATYVCLLIAILSKIFFQRIFLAIENDTSALLITTKNLLAGHGISVGRSFMEDLATKTYVTYIGWPPGYSLLSSPVMALFPDNFMLVSFCIDIFSTLVFFIYLRRVLQQLAFPAWLANLFILFQGFFLQDYIVTSHPTDFTALAFVVAGWYYCNNILINKKTGWNGFGCFFFFGAATLVRYQYMPVCVLSMAWMFYAGWKERNAVLKSNALRISLLLVVLTSLILIYQKVMSGHFLFQVYEMQKGFHPANILLASPFSLQAFIEIIFVSTQLSLLFGIDYIAATVILRMLAIPVLLATCYAAYKWFRARWATRFTSTDSCWITGFLLAAGTVLILCWLTATHGTLNNGWTFVMDGRYYAFTVLFIQLFAVLAAARALQSTGIRKVTAIIALATLSFSALHGLYVLVKKSGEPILAFDKILLADPEMRTMLHFIDTERRTHPGRIICIAGYLQIGYMADWHGVNALLDDELDFSKSLNTSKPVSLLLTFKKEYAGYYKKILSQPGFMFYKEEYDRYYYTLYLDPPTAESN